MWLVTAGPTREYLDEVRFLSNASSGRMGYALAAAAGERGEEVLLVSGPVSLPPPERVSRIEVVSALEMLEVCRDRCRRDPVRILFGVAAVCDLRPAARFSGKPSKAELPGKIDLVPNPDVLKSLRTEFPHLRAFGFALEDLGEGEAGREAALERARTKCRRKSLEAIVLNGLGAMDAGSAEYWWVPARGGAEALGARNKEDLARNLVDRVLAEPAP